MYYWYMRLKFAVCFLSLLVLTPATGKIRSPRSSIRGVVLAHVHSFGKGYGAGSNRLHYKRWKKMGVNSVQLNTFAYQRNKDSVGLYWYDPTLSDKAVLNEIKTAHSLGFSVMLKPHIWLGSSSKGEWRNAIDFKDPAQLRRWFKEYRRFLKHQLRLARIGRVEYFAVGTELVLLSRHTKLWKELIKWVRSSGYKGKLTYACEAWNAKHIKFWGDLDFIGLDFYYGFPQKKAGMRELTNFYRKKLREHYRHADSVGRPLILTELGFPSHALAVYKPHSWPSKAVPGDNNLQKFAFSAFRRALGEEGYPAGIFLWKYVTSLDSYEINAYKKGFILQGKPAEKEAAEMFRPR